MTRISESPTSPAALDPSPDPSPGAPGWARWGGLALAIALSIGAAFFAYRGAYVSGMTLDNKYIIQEYYLRMGELFPARPLVSWGQVFDIWAHDYWWPKGISGLYRPLTVLTYWFNYAVLDQKLEPAAYHHINNALHAIMAGLCCALGYVLTRRVWMAALIGLMFATHPITTESVTNIIGRADIIAGIAIVGGLLLHIGACRFVGLGRTPWLVGLVGLGLIGVFSKESSLALVPVVVAYDLVYRRDALRRLRALPAALAIAVTGLHLLIVLLWSLLALRDLAPRLVAGTPNPPLNFVLIAGTLIAALLPALLGIARPWARIGALAALGAVLAYAAAKFDLAPPAGNTFARSIGPLSVALAIALAVAAAVETLLWLLPRAAPWRAGRVFAQQYGSTLAVLAMLTIVIFAARARVFAGHTPPEEPFIDNPIRGIWKVRELGIESFERELAAKPLEGTRFVEGRMLAVRVIGKMIGKLVWPATLSADYSWSQIAMFTWTPARRGNALAYLSLALVAGLLWLAWRWRDRHPSAAFFILFFFASLLPTANLVRTIGSIMAERFLYVPLLGFCGAVVVASAMGLRLLLSRIGVERGQLPLVGAATLSLLLGAVCALYAQRTNARHPDWTDDLALWTATEKTSPGSFRTHQSLAFAKYETWLKEQESRVAHPTQNIDDIYRTAERALPIVETLPHHLNSARLYLHLGMYYNIKGETLIRRTADGRISVPRESLEWFARSAQILERAIPIDRAFNEVNHAREQRRGRRAPDDIPDAGLAPMYGFLADAYMKLGRFDDAIDTCRYLQQLDPASPESYARLARIYSAQGKPQLAATMAVAAALLAPDPAGLLMEAQGYMAQVSAADAAQALTSTDRGPRLNANNPYTRDTLTDAYAAVLRTFVRSRWTEQAQSARRVMVETHGMAPGFVDGIINDPATRERARPPTEGRPLAP